MDKKLEYLQDLEKIFFENKLMLKILHSYCEDETSQSEEISAILVGLDNLLEKHEKIEKIFDELYKLTGTASVHHQSV